MKNKLKWKKLDFDNSIIIWVSELKSLGWHLSIAKETTHGYEAFIYYGNGEDIPMFGNGHYFSTLPVAKMACEKWLKDLISLIKKL